MNDDEISSPALDVEGHDASEDVRPQRTHAELADLVETLLVHVKAHQAYIEVLHQKVAALEAVEEEATSHLPPWLTFPPPPAGEDKGNRGESPLFTIAHFVQYYNDVYVGKPGTRAVAIPDCWPNSPPSPTPGEQPTSATKPPSETPSTGTTAGASASPNASPPSGHTSTASATATNKLERALESIGTQRNIGSPAPPRRLSPCAPSRRRQRPRPQPR